MFLSYSLGGENFHHFLGTFLGFLSSAAAAFPPQTELKPEKMFVGILQRERAEREKEVNAESMIIPGWLPGPSFSSWGFQRCFIFIPTWGDDPI